MIDFHVHCDYSVDASGPVAEYAERACTRGLAAVCFTTHCDLDPARRDHDGRVRVAGEIVDVTSDWIGAYVEEVREVSRDFAGKGLLVGCGLEIGYVAGIESLIEAVVRSHRFDYILGGIHTVEGVDIVSSTESPAYFARRTPRKVCEAYYRVMDEAIRSDLFDGIAHFDIYKRCGLDFYGEELNVAHRGLVEPLLEEMAAKSISLEINSGGLRKALRWPYPSPDILREAATAGVTFVTPGSDAHRPDDVGSDLGWCLEIAGRAGFDAVAVFEQRSRRVIPLEEAHGS
jgi:histidinol-phosphatase (PHP family)